MDLYETLKLQGAQMDNHESDLYVRATPQAIAAIRLAGNSYSFFKSQIDGKTWIDVPFAYTPFWKAKAA